MNRRSLLKTLGVVGAASALPSGEAAAREPRRLPPDAVGLLYDATRCIGCKACVARCKEVNGLPPSTTLGALWDAPPALDGATKNVIQLARDGDRTSFVKRQCMHCADPACVSVCMIGALSKGPRGIVSYDPDRCVGCRYCQAACPFDVPKFEWEKATPKIVKCELCRTRLDVGKLPGCVEACPREAVIFGSVENLKKEAHARLAANPGHYQPRVYGETEGGGTQVLYLSALPFEKLGLPVLPDEPIPELAETVNHGIYKGFLAPAALYAALGLVLLRNRRKNAEGDHEENER